MNFYLWLPKWNIQNGMMEVIYQRSMDFQEIRNHCGNQLYFQCMKLIRTLYLKMLRHIQILWQNIGQFILGVR